MLSSILNGTVQIRYIVQMHFTNQILTASKQFFVYIEKVIIFIHMHRLNFLKIY